MRKQSRHFWVVSGRGSDGCRREGVNLIGPSADRLSSNATSFPLAEHLFKERINRGSGGSSRTKDASEEGNWKEGVHLYKFSTGVYFANGNGGKTN